MNSPEARDRRFAQRFAIALAASICVHEIVAGIWPRPSQGAPKETVVAQIVTLTRRLPSPKPTRAPTPRPTPRITPAPRPSLAPQVAVRAPAAKAAATPARTLGGAAARKHVVRTVPKRPRPAPPVSLAEGTHAGRQNGGAGTGAGAGTGTGGLAGTSTGSGTSGTGNGGDANAACADVYLLAGNLSHRKDGAVVQQVLAKIVRRDGTVEVDRFPYPFVYSADSENPFFHDVGLAKNGGIAVQMPPADIDRAALPDTVRVVLEHTNPLTGATNLPECEPQTAP